MEKQPLKKTYFVRAIWDDEAKTYYSESDIWGLHLETPSLEEFEELVADLGPEMIVANHMTPEVLATTPVLGLMPTIVFYRPEPARTPAAA